MAECSWEAARAVVTARAEGMASALARLGVLTASEYVEAIDTATLTVVAYYGAIFPIGRKACKRIDVAKRRGLAMLGHSGERTARWLVHERRPVGLELAYTWPHAAAALVVGVDRAWQASASAPARVAAESRTAKEVWRMGWRPTSKEPSPMDFDTRHATAALTEEGIAAANLKYLAEAGVRTRAAAGDGAAGALARCYDATATGEGATASVWAQEGRTYGWRLARLGAVQRRHFYTADAPVQGQRHGRWRTPAELGAYLGRGGRQVGRMRVGARLTAAERGEYLCLLSELTAEEEEWAKKSEMEPLTRPLEPVAEEVLSAGADRRGRAEYLLRWSDGVARWGPRPTAVTPQVRRALGTARQAWEQRAADSGGGELRSILRGKHGEAWLYLATMAPQAVGRRDPAGMVRAAEAAGVATARQPGGVPEALLEEAEATDWRGTPGQEAGWASAAAADAVRRAREAVAEAAEEAPLGQRVRVEEGEDTA